MGNAFISLQSGRGVGGGTLVNSAISFRTPDAVLAEWVDEHGVDIWADRDQRRQRFEEVERVIGVAPTDPSVGGNNTEIARRGAEALGLEGAYMPRSAPGCAGCGTCQTGCPSGGKASADNTWLPRALRAGAQLWADTRVDTIRMEKGRAVGVRGVMRDPEQGGEVVAEIEARADRVILACGAINTPMLLQAHGDLANSSGMVGRNLHCHPGVACLARMREDVVLWWGATQGYYMHHPDDPEILLETFSASPDILVAQAGGVGAEATAFLKDLRKIAACGLLIRDHSTGSVSWKEGGRPGLTYHLVESDRQKMIRGLEQVAELFFAAGAEAVRPLTAGAGFLTSLNETRAHLQAVRDPADMQLYASHPMGTCRIGRDPERAVVRPRDGRTHDVEGLYITDSSLFPTALGVNPQVTIMSQSLALARRMIQRG